MRRDDSENETGQTVNTEHGSNLPEEDHVSHEQKREHLEEGPTGITSSEQDETFSR